jgi:hypothetical protein
VALPGAPEVAFGGVGWGDFNNDGYFDALISGTQSSNGVDATTLLLNAGPGTKTTYTVNTRPTAPTGLSAAVSGDTVALTWGRDTDAETPQLGLTYAVRVGTTSGGSDVVSLAAGSDGKRRVAALGVQGLNTHWILRGLAPGHYFWSVQAIDNGYMGSPLASERTFTIPTISAKVRFILQGAYATADDSMPNLLRKSGVLATKFTGAAIPARAVDSINIEIRDSATAAKATIRLFSPAWLLTDGTVCSFTDSTQPYVTFNAPVGFYHIVVRHRNHLAVMSKDSLALTGSSPSYDFTTGQNKAYGSNALVQAGTRYCLIAGDADGSGDVTILDRALWRTQNSQSGYLGADMNLSGDVTILDRTLWRANNSLSSQVP